MPVPLPGKQSFINKIFASFIKPEDVAVKNAMNSEVSGEAYNHPLYNQFKNTLESGQNRMARYKDYDDMDEQTFGSRTLDIYASLITMGEVDNQDDSGAAYKVVTKDPKLAEQFKKMEDRLDLKRQLYSKVRTSLKYGVNSQEKVFTEYVGISKLKFIKPATFFLRQPEDREEDETIWAYQKDDQGNIITKFKEFQVLLLKIESDESRQYGRSIFNSVRKDGKVIEMLETSLAYREATRAIQRWLWKIDCSGLEPDKAYAYVKKVMFKNAKPRLVDPVTGKVSISTNFLNDVGDIGLPIFKDGAEADILPLTPDRGTANTAVIDYFLNKWFGGVGLPRSYFSFEKSLSLRSNFSYQDSIVARSVYRFQKDISSPLYDMYKQEAEFHGFEDPEFKLVLPLMGTVDDLRKWQIMQIKVGIAQTLALNMHLVDDNYVYEKILNLEPKEIQRLMKFRQNVKVAELDMQNLANQGAFIQPSTTVGEQRKMEELLNSTRTIKHLLEQTELKEAVDSLRELCAWQLEYHDNINYGDEISTIRKKSA